ncbi:MAG: ABC transporter permease [Pirellulales bacterium]|nr:ABC transporter permease [Pirellulales bacterium]
MSLWTIAWRSLQQRGVSSLLTGLSMALGVTLMVAILSAGRTVQDAYESGPRLNHDVIVGPKGSSTQLVLNTEFHIDKTLPSTLPWTYYQEFLPAKDRPDKVDGRFAKYVDLAIPICKGDSYKDAHVIGTTPEYFWSPPDEEPLFSLAEGEIFGWTDYNSAVVGSRVAAENGFSVGSTFRPTHGIEPTGDAHEHEPVKIVGVLATTGTPADRAIFMNLDGFLMIHHEENEAKERASTVIAAPAATAATPSEPHNHAAETAAKESTTKDHTEHDHAGHDHEGHDHAHGPLPDSKKAVTAILVRTKQLQRLDRVTGQYQSVGVGSGLYLIPLVNQDVIAQAVNPIKVTAEFSQQFVQPLVTILAVMTGLIVLASAVSILVGIYNSMHERRQEIGILRALGAGRQTVMLLMFLETILLALLGGLAGWFLGHLLMAGAGPILTPRTGIVFAPWDVSPWELILVPGLILLAGIVGFLPAVTAYRTDVSQALSGATA